MSMGVKGLVVRYAAAIVAGLLAKAAQGVGRAVARTVPDNDPEDVFCTFITRQDKADIAEARATREAARMQRQAAFYADSVARSGKKGRAN